MRYLVKMTPAAMVVALCVGLCACAQTKNNVATTAPVNWTAEAVKRVILVDPDVELSELTAGGVTEARADWTKTGKEFIRADIASTLKAKGIDIVAADATSDRHEPQLVKLHGALGQSIMLSSIVPFPTKKNNFNWTLGPGAVSFRDHYHGDYALFVFVRDSYSSAGRQAMIVAAAMLGVGVQGGQQIGFASLVDLRTGQVVWFNRLASQYGSLKEDKPAAETVKHLLDGLPL